MLHKDGGAIPSGGASARGASLSSSLAGSLTSGVAGASTCSSASDSPAAPRPRKLCSVCSTSCLSSGATQPAMCEGMHAARLASVVSSNSCAKHGRRELGCARKASTDMRPHGSQSGVAKLELSATLSPCEKPAW
eukprot:scaffold202145_cov29-Tisochrysis_lutea.AAC.3